MVKKRKRHTPEQIVKKLRDGEAMLNADQEMAVVLQTMEVSDNGPEFVAKSIQNWLKKLEIQTMYLKPGSPWKNRLCRKFQQSVSR